MKKLETEAKKTTKKTVKKTTKTTDKLKVKELKGSGADVAYFLGVTTANITQLEQTNTIHRNEEGTFDLVDAVSSYCRALRERKAGNSKTEIDTETAIWKLQNLKIKNRDWRMQRDRMVATEILRMLTDSMGEIRELAKLNPALCDEIDIIIGRIGKIDVDSISLAVEGDEEEDDE